MSDGEYGGAGVTALGLSGGTGQGQVAVLHRLAQALVRLLHGWGSRGGCARRCVRVGVDVGVGVDAGVGVGVDAGAGVGVDVWVCAFMWMCVRVCVSCEHVDWMERK
jgi:hypothetical protein